MEWQVKELLKNLNSMKIALLLPGNLYFCPYVKIYTRILEEEGVKYDIIFWDRDGINETGGISYSNKFKILNNRLFKIIPYFLYCSFIKKQITKTKYDYLIVFGPQLAIFLLKTLKKKYYKKIIFDYRDLSIEQKLKKQFKRFLEISSLNVISSPGFRQCLPNEYNYIISHNVDINTLNNSLTINNSVSIPCQPIDILTIGGIRDYDSNIEIVKSLGNTNNFNMRFIGKGYASDKIEKFSKDNNIYNIQFKGFYQKEEEESHIAKCSFLNIYYPSIISHSTALSNRFYNALLYKKPMIVTNNSIQGYYVEKYKLGISTNDCADLSSKIHNYISNLDKEEFSKNCRDLLIEFKNDYITFKEKVINTLLGSNHI